MSEELIFPSDFIWGAGQSAYQTEGNNSKNDWYDFEHQQNTGAIEPCGKSCEYYTRFDSDHALIASLGLNTYRTGIEWSRIFPEENCIDEDELEHYHKVFRSLEKHNLTKFVTIHHFTIPKWFRDKGGFLKSKNLAYFERYCKVIAENFPEVEYWNPINEPNVIPFMGYLAGEFPPNKKSLISFFRVTRNILKAHAIAYHALKEQNPKSKVGIVKTMPYFIQKDTGRFTTKYYAKIADYAFNQVSIACLKSGKVPFTPFTRKSWLRETSDFFGLNYYDATYFKIRFGIPLGYERKFPGVEKTTMVGWGIYPKGLYEGIMRLKRDLKMPIIVTENGIATLDDELRQEFILQHLREVHRAIQNGADVRGYIYWSSIDNFEWLEGFAPRFGLIDIDYNSQKRTIRESGELLGHIAKQNKISREMKVNTKN